MPDSAPATAGASAAGDSRPGGLVVRPLTVADAEQIAAWRYEGRWRTRIGSEFGAAVLGSVRGGIE